MPTLTATAGLLGPLTRERALLLGLLASIVLHALVLVGLSRYAEPAPASKALLALTARLAPFASAPQASAPTRQPERSPPQAPTPGPTQRPALAQPPVPPAPAPREIVRSESEKVATLEPAPSLPGATDTTAQGAAPVPPRPAPQSTAGASGAVAAVASGNEADAGTLAQYRLALIVATRRYKRYPAIAMEKGWQGRVEVHMVIGADGTIADASIKAGSGYEILDNQALDMLKKGKSSVPIPVSLRGREFRIDVPVIFSLDNPSS